MLLFEKTTVDLAFERWYFILEVRIIFVSSLTLFRQLGLKSDGLILQLVEGVLVFAIAGAYFIFQVAQLQVHLSSRLWSALIIAPKVLALTRHFAWWKSVRRELIFSLSEVLRLLRWLLGRSLVTLLSGCELLLLLLEKRFWMRNMVRTRPLVLIAERLTRLGCHCNWVDISDAFCTLEPAAQLPRLEDCGCQFGRVLLVHFMAGCLKTSV